MRTVGVYLGGLAAGAVVACGAPQPIGEAENEGQGGGLQGLAGSAAERSTGGRSSRSWGSGATASSPGGTGGVVSPSVGWGGESFGATSGTGGRSTRGTGGRSTPATGGASTPATGGRSIQGTGGASIVVSTGGAAGGVVFYGGWTAAGGTPTVGGYAGFGGSVTSGEWPADCSARYHSSSPDYCDVELECSNGWVWAYCDMWESSEPWCECESDLAENWQTWQFSGVPDGDPCVLVANLCLGRGEPALQFTEPACTPSYQELGAEWCDMEQQCTQTAEVTDEISVSTSEWQYTWCELSGDVWACSCSAGRGSMSFDYPGPVEASDVCPNALELCSAGATEIRAPTECTPYSQWASVDSCDAQHDCTGAATIAGTQIQVHQSMFTNCYALADGRWRCDCSLGSKHLSIELSSPDAWSSCQAAAASCFDAMNAVASG